MSRELICSRCLGQTCHWTNRKWPCVPVCSGLIWDHLVMEAKDKFCLWLSTVLHKLHGSVFFIGPHHQATEAKLHSASVFCQIPSIIFSSPFLWSQSVCTQGRWPASLSCIFNSGAEKVAISLDVVSGTWQHFRVMEFGNFIPNCRHEVTCLTWLFLSRQTSPSWLSAAFTVAEWWCWALQFHLQTRCSPSAPASSPICCPLDCFPPSLVWSGGGEFPLETDGVDTFLAGFHLLSGPFCRHFFSFLLSFCRFVAKSIRLSALLTHSQLCPGQVLYIKLFVLLYLKFLPRSSQTGRFPENVSPCLCTVTNWWTLDTYVHHTHPPVEHMVFVCPDQRGEALFPLFMGICWREGQSSKFKDQEVMHLHHLVDFNSKYQQQLQSPTFTAEYLS